MNRWIGFCIFLLLASCAPSPAPSPTAIPSPTPSHTATETATPVPTRTNTPSPTATATPTPSPTVTPTPRIIIDSGNAGSLVKGFQIQHPDTQSVVFSPDSTWLLIGSGEASRGNYLVSMWWPDGYQGYDLIPAAATVWEAAFSPGGKWAAYVVDNPSQDFRGYVVDIESKSPVASLPGRGTAYSLSFSPDGTRLALGGSREYPNGIIWLYNTSDWGLISELSVLGQDVRDLVFSPDGTRLYSAGTDGRIRIWNPADGLLLNNFQKSRQANRIALSPDGSFLASIYCMRTDSNGCTLGGVAVWNTAGGKTVKTFEDIALSVAFSPDGSLLATGGDFRNPLVRIRSTSTWKIVGQAETMANCLAFSPDGRLLAVADYEGVTIWSIS